MRLHKAAAIIVITLALLVSLPCSSRAGIPSDQVRQTADKVLSILQDTELKSADKKQERRDRLRQVISARFDFDEMAKRALGQHWQRRSADERRRFVRLFTDLLWRSYADQIESFKGKKIVYAREQQDKDYAEVDTKIVTNKGEEFSVNYLLHAIGSEWKVYDVVIENISLVNNYRSQFNHVLANSSFDELMRKLQAKAFNAPANSKA
jgi:phospholipid transport system substrate-binding protein